jgi:hypothetical protein
MIYTVTILLEAGTYEEITLDVPVDIEEDWAHFLTNRTVRDAMLPYTNYTVIDIDPHIDFKRIDEVIEE